MSYYRAKRLYDFLHDNGINCVQSFCNFIHYHAGNRKASWPYNMTFNWFTVQTRAKSILRFPVLKSFSQSAGLNHITQHLRANRRPDIQLCILFLNNSQFDYSSTLYRYSSSSGSLITLTNPLSDPE